MRFAASGVITVTTLTIGAIFGTVPITSEVTCEGDNQETNIGRHVQTHLHSIDQQDAASSPRH